MKKWLTKEYIVKRKAWRLILETIIDTFIITLLIFISVTEYNTEIVELLSTISADNLGYAFAKIMFPVVLIMVTMFKVCLFMISDMAEERKKELNAENKKRKK